MKKLLCLIVGMVAIAIGVVQSTEMLGIGREEFIRGSASLTNVYVGTTARADLQNYNAATLRLYVASGGGAATFSIKPQWSDNATGGTATNWVDESVLVAGTASGGEQVYTNLSRVIQIKSTEGGYIERYNRLARFFRVSVKSDTASPTWSSIKGVEVSVTPVTQ